MRTSCPEEPARAGRDFHRRKRARAGPKTEKPLIGASRCSSVLQMVPEVGSTHHVQRGFPRHAPRLAIDTVASYRCRRRARATGASRDPTGGGPRPGRAAGTTPRRPGRGGPVDSSVLGWRRPVSTNLGHGNSPHRALRASLDYSDEQARPRIRHLGRRACQGLRELRHSATAAGILGESSSRESPASSASAAFALRDRPIQSGAASGADDHDRRCFAASRADPDARAGRRLAPGRKRDA